jgi:hypothetical protein
MTVKGHSASHLKSKSNKITTMNINMKSAFVLFGLLFGALAISSCSDTGAANHQMPGSPDKMKTMRDDQMPGR